MFLKYIIVKQNVVTTTVHSPWRRSRLAVSLTAFNTNSKQGRSTWQHLVFTDLRSYYCILEPILFLSLSWWRHQMETFSVLLAICAGNSPVTGEFPAQRPVTRSFDIFFDLRLNKRLSKQSWGWWFETLSHPLWRHCNVSADRWQWILKRQGGVANQWQRSFYPTAIASNRCNNTGSLVWFV